LNPYACGLFTLVKYGGGMKGSALFKPANSLSMEPRTPLAP